MSGIRGDRSLRKVGDEGSAYNDEHECNAAGWAQDLTPGERVQLRARGRLPKVAKDTRREVYEEAYAAWLAGMSEEDRFKLKGLGLDKPVPEDRFADRSDGNDPEEDQSGTAQVERTAAPKQDLEEVPNRLSLEAVCLVLPAIVDAPNPRLVASIIALAVDELSTRGVTPPLAARQGITVLDLARVHEVSSRWVQKQVRAWVVKLGISRLSLDWVRFILSFILESKTPRLKADILCSAASISLRQGTSWRKQSAGYGIGVAAWSAQVRRWVNRMGLPLPRDCKQNTANYQFTNPQQLPRKAKKS